MDDTISRSALLHEIDRLPFGLMDFPEFARVNQIVRIISEQPAADAEPVRYAEWIPWEDNGKVSKHLMTCSGCRRYQWPKNDVLAFDRCPKCGAKMDGQKVKEEENNA